MHHLWASQSGCAHRRHWPTSRTTWSSNHPPPSMASNIPSVTLCIPDCLATADPGRRVTFCFGKHTSFIHQLRCFPGGSVVKNLPAVPEIRVRSLGWKDPRKKGMATHSSSLAWRFPWTEEPGRAHKEGHKESDMTDYTSTFFQPGYRDCCWVKMLQFSHSVMSNSLQPQGL